MFTYIFLINYTFVNYTYKITLTYVFLPILSFFRVFFKYISMNFESFSSYQYLYQNIHQYFRYIRKIQVSIYLSLPIFQTMIPTSTAPGSAIKTSPRMWLSET